MKIFVGVLVVAVLFVGGFVAYLVLKDNGVDVGFLKNFQGGIDGREKVILSFNNKTTKIDIVDDARSVVPIMSPSGERWAYSVGDWGNKNMSVVVDGTRGNTYDLVLSPIFSPDSSRFAYLAVKGNEYFAVIDGNEGPHYEYSDRDINFPVHGGIFFDPTGKHVVYLGNRGGKVFFVIDEKEGPQYDYLLSPQFSESGELIAYIAKREKKFFVVYKNKEGKAYDIVSDLSISADGNRYAYVGENVLSVQGSRMNTKSILVVDGVEESRYKGYSLTAFSPDGSRFAFGATLKESSYPTFLRGDDIASAFEKYGERQALVVRDQSGDHTSEKQYESISFVRFSPDGERIAYLGKKPYDVGNIGTYVVVDDKEFAAKEYYRNISYPVFSSDSKHVAYMVHRDGKGPIPPQDSVVIDGKAGEFYDYAGVPIFSPTGDSVGYVVRIGKQYTWIVERVADRLAPPAAQKKSEQELPKSVELIFNPVEKKSPPYTITFQATLKNLPACGNKIVWYFGNSPTEIVDEKCSSSEAPNIVPTRTIERSHAYSRGDRYQALVEVNGIKSQTKTIDLVFSSNDRVIINLPNGGEMLPKGKPFWMSWGGSSVPPFDIYLIKSGVRVSTLEKNHYSIGYTWYIPSDIASGSDYKIEVVSGPYSDMSDGTFSIQ